MLPSTEYASASSDKALWFSGIAVVTTSEHVLRFPCFHGLRMFPSDSARRNGFHYWTNDYFLWYSSTKSSALATIIVVLFKKKSEPYQSKSPLGTLVTFCTLLGTNTPKTSAPFIRRQTCLVWTSGGIKKICGCGMSFHWYKGIAVSKGGLGLR